MEIKTFIRSLNIRELLALRNYIDYRLDDFHNRGFGDLTLKAFEQKLRNEKDASIRLIYAINNLKDKFDYVHQITRSAIIMQRNVGVKTWKEFVKFRGY